MPKDYGLSFISNEDLFFHVKTAIDNNGINGLCELESNGSLHQSLLKTIATKKQCLSKGFDVISKPKKIFAELKSKCPSMNSPSVLEIH